VRKIDWGAYRLEWHNLFDGWQHRRGLEQALHDDIRGKNAYQLRRFLELEAELDNKLTGEL
jgi:hypothetical protein